MTLEADEQCVDTRANLSDKNEVVDSLVDHDKHALFSKGARIAYRHSTVRGSYVNGIDLMTRRLTYYNSCVDIFYLDKLAGRNVALFNCVFPDLK